MAILLVSMASNDVGDHKDEDQEAATNSDRHQRCFNISVFSRSFMLLSKGNWNIKKIGNVIYIFASPAHVSRSPLAHSLIHGSNAPKEPQENMWISQNFSKIYLL